MSQRIDATTMRRFNKATVLQCVRNQGPISRIGIAEITGLNKATVSSLVDELIVEQFVLEVGYGDSNGGRKPMLLEFNADAAFTIGLDVQITHVTSVVCNINGTVLRERTVQMSPAADDVRAYLLTVVKEQATKAIAAAPKSPHGVLGVGIGLPGMVNFHAGHVFMLPNMGVMDWDIRTPLIQQLGLPVFIDNDANCGAWAKFNRNPETKNLVYVNAGIGVGAGIVVGGQLYRGSHGVSGEYGHSTIAAMGIRCVCGNYGCWERYASEESLVRYLQENGVTESFEALGEHFVQHVVRSANRGKAEYANALYALGQFLGIGIANIVNTLNPDVVYLGGHLAAAHKYLLPLLQMSMKQRCMNPVRQTPIHVADSDSVAIGAAGIAMSETLYA